MIDTQRQEETSDVTKESKNQAMNEVKTVENIRIARKLKAQVTYKKKALPHINCKVIKMSNIILLN